MGGSSVTAGGETLVCTVTYSVYMLLVYGLAICVCVFQAHLLVCPLVEISCDFGCGMTITRCDIIEHHTVCNNRAVQCTYCNVDVQLNLMEVCAIIVCV